MVAAGEPGDLRRQRRRSQRAAGDDGATSARIKCCDLLPVDGDERLAGDGFGDQPRELHSINGKRMSCRDRTCICAGQQWRAGTAHLLLQEPGRSVLAFALERVGTDQLAEVGGLVGRRHPRRAHLEQVYRDAQPRCDQRRVRPRQSAADDADARGHRSTSAADNACCPMLRVWDVGLPTLCNAAPDSRILRHSSSRSAPSAP